MQQTWTVGKKNIKSCFINSNDCNHGNTFSSHRVKNNEVMK